MSLRERVVTVPATVEDQILRGLHGFRVDPIQGRIFPNARSPP
jgi:hypothetical protein